MRAVALALLLAYPAAATDVYDAPGPAPASYAALLWRNGGVDVPGYWATAKQVQATDLRIRYLEDRAAKECTTATNAETKKILGAAPTLWVGIGIALAVGVAGGFYLGRK